MVSTELGGEKNAGWEFEHELVKPIFPTVYGYHDDILTWKLCRAAKMASH